MSPARAEVVVSSPPVTVAVPSSALATAPLAVDPGSVPGVRLAGVRSWALEAGGQLDAFCVKAPAPWWLPGLEHTALVGGASLSRKALAADILQLGGSQRVGHGWSQSFEVGGGSLASSARGTVHLAFVGQRPDALVCSVTCRGSSSCETALTWPELAPVPAPPALLAEAALHPLPALASTALLLGLAVIAILHGRPRPRW